MEHTEGKWEITDTNKHGDQYVSSVDNDGYIAIVCYRKEVIANARLIAAAPQTAKQRDELLAVCEEIRKVILKLLDDADSERMSRQNSTDSDFYLSEGKYIGVEKAESQIGKIINNAKAAIAAKE